MRIIEWIMENNLRRWVFFLPLSVIGAFLITVIWEIINQITIARMGSVRSSFLYNLYYMPISGIIAGFTFTYIGGYIAPNKSIKKILLGFIIVIGLITISNNFFIKKDTNYWVCINGIFMVIGAFIANSYLKNERQPE